MQTRKNLFLLTLSSLFICCSQAEHSRSCWNSSMDSLLANYLCASQSDCESNYGHPEDVVYGVDAQKLNCLIDSLAKYKSGLSYTEYYLFENIPDSVFHLSEKAVDQITSTKDSCLRELGMVALSEKRLIAYEFKNICHIQKFEGVKKVSVRELGDYWLFDYDYESSSFYNDSLEKRTQDFITESIKQNKYKNSYEIGSCIGEVIGDYTEPYFGGLEIALNFSMEDSCFTRQNLWPFYISISSDTIHLKITPPTNPISSDTIHLKITPPTNLLYADDKDARNYNTYNEQSTLNILPKSGKRTVHLPWVPQRTVHFFKESTFSPFDHLEAGNILVVDIPCFDEEVTKKYYAFHITKTKYPYLRCVVNPITNSFASIKGK